MKIAVIGGSGFIGSFVIKKLLEQGHELIALDRTPKKSIENVDFFECDILNQKKIVKAWDMPDYNW